MATFLESPLWPLVGIPLLIFLARVIDVSLSTIRIVYVSRGVRLVAPIIGFIEILVWLTAITHVLQHLDHPINFLAYAGGFAVGTWVGLLIEDKLALGLVAVRIISKQDASELPGKLEKASFGVTSFAARGVSGRVRFLLTVIRRRELRRLLKLLAQEQPDAFISVSDVRMASQGFFNPGSLGHPGLASSFKGKK
jgi:uncharacterized protein YebE (UPF0316 family)